jgi:hypothetical protein
VITILQQHILQTHQTPPQVVGRLGVGSAGQFRDCYGADGL